MCCATADALHSQKEDERVTIEGEAMTRGPVSFYLTMETKVEAAGEEMQHE